MWTKHLKEMEIKFSIKNTKKDPNQERPLSVNLKEILKLKSTSLNNLNEISEENKCSKNAKSPISSSRSSSPFSLDLNYRPSEKLTVSTKTWTEYFWKKKRLIFIEHF